MFRFEYDHESKPLLTVKIKLFPFVSITREIDFSNETNQSLAQINLNNFYDQGRAVLETIKEMNHSFSSAFQYVSFHRLDWRTKAGTGEAFSTGMASAGVWTVKGILVAYLGEKMDMHCHPSIHFEPQFNRTCFSTTVEGIVSIRTGKAIHILKQYKKSKEESKEIFARI